MRKLSVIVWVLAAWALPGAAAGDERLEALVADIVSRAATDSERAANLCKAAEDAADDVPAQVYLLEKAVEYGLKRPSYPDCRAVVAGSLDLLDEKDPDRKDLWTARRLELYRGWYRLAWGSEQKQAAGKELVAVLAGQGAAREKDRAWGEAAASYLEAHSVAAAARLPDSNALMNKYLRANHARRTSVKVRAHLALLAGSPDDVAARTALLTLLVVDMDDPAAAAEHLTEQVSPAWSARIRQAAAETDELDAADCRKLGEWYDKELRARAGSAVAKTIVLSRAQTYYARCLADETDASRDAAVKAALSRVRAELAKLAAPPRTPSRPPPSSSKGSSGTSGRPKGAVEYRGHYYRVVRERVTWDQAKLACEKLGGQLVCIETTEELAFVERLAGSRRLSVGATDERIEGRWTWLNGRPVGEGQKFWYRNEPTGGREQNYGSIMRGGLMDGSKSQSSVSGYICEWGR